MGPESVSAIAAVATALIAGVGLTYAGMQLRATKQAAQGEFLLHLEELWATHWHIHLRLRPGGEWADGGGPQSPEEWALVEYYMGLFERINVLASGGLSITYVQRFYGYRLNNIWANKMIREKKLKPAGKLSEFWNDFSELSRRVDEVEPGKFKYLFHAWPSVEGGLGRRASAR